MTASYFLGTNADRNERLVVAARPRKHPARPDHEIHAVKPHARSFDDNDLPDSAAYFQEVSF